MATSIVRAYGNLFGRWTKITALVVFTHLFFSNNITGQITAMYAWVWNGDTGNGTRLTKSAQKKLDEAKKNKKTTPIFYAVDYEYYSRKIMRNNNGCPTFSNHYGAVDAWKSYGSICNAPPSNKVFL